MFKKINRTYVRWSLEVLIIIAAAGAAVWENNHKPLNVVLVTFDSLRADHLGCYGYSKNTSPFLDQLAVRSQLFRRCISPALAAPPAAAALLTSRYPYLDGMLEAGDQLNPEALTLAEYLKGKGYLTVAIVGSPELSRESQFARGFDFFDDFKNAHNAQQMLVQVLKIFERPKLRFQKIFLWIHFQEPRYPYEVPRVAQDDFSDVRCRFNDAEKTSYSVLGKKEALTRRQVREYVAAYDRNVRYADEQLGAIFYYLSKKNILQNSIIFVTANHGELLGEHSGIGHDLIYEKSLQVPLLMRIPRLPDAVVRNDPVSPLDIFPTIIELLGFQEDLPWLASRGTSLMREQGQERALYSETPDKFSISKGGYRLSFNQESRQFRVSNIESDPDEEFNLADVYPRETLGLLQELFLLRSAGQDETDAPGEQQLLLEQNNFPGPPDQGAPENHAPAQAPGAP